MFLWWRDGWMDGWICVIDHVKPKHFTYSIWGNYFDKGICLGVSVSPRRAPKGQTKNNPPKYQWQQHLWFTYFIEVNFILRVFYEWLPPSLCVGLKRWHLIHQSSYSPFSIFPHEKIKMIKHFKIVHGKLNNKTILNELVISIY